MLKFFERLRSRLLGSTTTGLVTVLALGGTVAAITSPDFTYTSTKTGYYTIHPMALGPGSGDASFAIQFDGTLKDFNSNCYSTGVNLPAGSRITQLAVWYSSPAVTNPTVFLRRVTLADGTSASLITSGSISDDTDTRKLAVLPIAAGSGPVSNTGFAYAFGICPGQGGTFHGARIAYTYTSAGD